MSVWAEQAQESTWRQAERTGSEWTVAELNKLTIMRAAGKSVTECARVLGRTYYAVSTRLQLAGMAETRARAVWAVAACGECHLVHRGECL